MIIVPAFEMPEALVRQAVAELRREDDHRRHTGRPPSWHLAVALALEGRLPSLAACGHSGGQLVVVSALSDHAAAVRGGSSRSLRRKAVPDDLPAPVSTDRPWSITTKVAGRLILIEGAPSP